MSREGIMRTIAIVLLAGCVFAGLALASEDAEEGDGIPAKLVADYIHAVLQADRTLYTTHVVERMQDSGIVMATEGWKKRSGLPLPAQMLQLSGLKAEQDVPGLKYRLASLFPIYERNGPTTDFERKGLEAVQKDPSKPYTGVITRGERRYFKAIYADLAVSKACVTCHNGHILSAKRDRKVGDVMGGIIISFPLSE